MTEIYLPDFPAPASVSIRQKQRTRRSVAESGKILTRLYGGSTYAVTLSYNPMRKDQAANLIAFLHEVQGRHGIFRVRLPQLNDQDGQVGSFVNFVGDTKLHMIIKTSPFTVAPNPRGGTAIDPAGPYISCSLDNDVQEIRLGKNRLIRLDINVTERT